MANHIVNFQNNLKEVGELSEIHRQIAGGKVGRKSNVQTLNKSSIVLLTACWEYYIEDLASAAFDFLLSNSLQHDIIPQGVRIKASKEIRNDKDERRVWDLAGDGWRTILSNYKVQILKKEIDYFHTPRPGNIDTLYENLLDIKKISESWKWKKMSNAKVVDTLNEFIDLRGSIAHSVKADKKVWKKTVTDYSNLLNCLAVITHNSVTDFLHPKVGKTSWEKYKYGEVK